MIASSVTPRPFSYFTMNLAIVSIRGEAVLVQAAGELVQPSVHLLPRRLGLVLIRHHEGLVLVLAPAGNEIDLVRGDDERRLVTLQDVQALDRLRPEPLVQVDDEDREVRERAAACAERRERDMTGGVDEQQARDPE